MATDKDEPDKPSDDPATCAHVLAEVRLMREQLSALVQELRMRKRKAVKRSRTLSQRAANDQIAEHRPTALQLAQARRALRR